MTEWISSQNMQTLLQQSQRTLLKTSHILLSASMCNADLYVLTNIIFPLSCCRTRVIRSMCPHTCGKKDNWKLCISNVHIIIMRMCGTTILTEHLKCFEIYLHNFSYTLKHVYTRPHALPVLKWLYSKTQIVTLSSVRLYWLWILSKFSTSLLGLLTGKYPPKECVKSSYKRSCSLRFCTGTTIYVKVRRVR